MIRKKKGTLKEGTPGRGKGRAAKLESRPLEAAPPGASVETAPDKSVGGQISNQPTMTEPDTFSHANVGFPIVGIGASAGGLAAFESFFSGMPADIDPGMAFVLVQHLAPDHKSILAELIGRYTRMQVFEVEDGMTVQPNCAYIIPPNRDMAFQNGVLQLMEPVAPRGQRLPVDFFFRSLAQDQRERAIGIVLSGMGSDGTLGVRAIKGEGGMVMAQSPASTEYDGMTQSAIATGLIDYELPPAKMPAQLIAYAAHAYGKPPLSFSVTLPKVENALKKIFILLRSQTGHDFSLYKPSTIHRRIERRMAVHQIDTMDGYVRYLQQTPAEVETLFRDVLIGVTNFFRDPEAFKMIEEKIIPKILAGKSASDAIRCWSPGCSTGEEAYSLAILIAECQEAMKQTFKVQVFATDIDSQAIATARLGLYPASIAADVSPERLARFFTAESSGSAYRIHKAIRDMVVFSEQSVIKDPPSSKLDFISCRNLLIYMGGELQKKLIPLFHYALNPGGFLFLGTSETVGEFLDLFAAADRELKIYQRKEDFLVAQREALRQFLPPMPKMDAAVPRTAGKAASPVKLPLRELIEQALLQQIALVGALVNSKGDILYIHGHMGMYLEMTPGEAGVNNILKMARFGLRQELAMALQKAVQTKAIVRYPGLRIKTNGDFTTVNLTIHPVETGQSAVAQGSRASMTPEWPLLYLVILEEAPVQVSYPSGQTRPTEAGVGRVTARGDDGPSPTPDADGFKTSPELSPGELAASASIAVLREELRAKKEYLQSANEQLESSNEELKSSNEEMQSVNEEFQSTNEELETSREELQSVNEELGTVNSELEQKVYELSRANNDMNNLLSGTGVATVFLDHRLNIRRFTPTATQLMNLIQTDVGRQVGHIVSNLVGYESLLKDTQEVLNTLIPKELEVRTKKGDWYLLRIRPYRTLENVIEGAVLTFTEITELRQAQAQAQAQAHAQAQAALRESKTQRRLAVVVFDSHDAITVQDLDGLTLAWNPAAERIYGWSETEALTMNIRDRIPGKQREEAFTHVQQLARADVLEPYRAQRLAKDGRIVEVWLTATALLNETGKIYAIATTERKIEKNE